jgi:hypothetical protein
MAQNRQMFNFLTNFVWNQMSMGVIFMKKNSNVFKLGPQSVGRFHQKGTCQAAEKSPTKKFHFEFTIQIEQGSFLHKKLLRSKVTILGIGPMAHVGKIFI